MRRLEDRASTQGRHEDGAQRTRYHQRAIERIGAALLGYAGEVQRTREGKSELLGIIAALKAGIVEKAMYGQSHSAKVKADRICYPLFPLSPITMSVAIHFTPSSMKVAQYDEVIRRLNEAGAGQPAGREYHVCFGTDGALQVLDVWTSVEAFQKFGETLLPILSTLGIDPGQPRIEPAQNVIVPSAIAAV